MKIKRSQLKQIIKEEIKKIMIEEEITSHGTVRTPDEDIIQVYTNLLRQGPRFGNPPPPGPGYLESPFSGTTAALAAFDKAWLEDNSPGGSNFEGPSSSWAINRSSIGDLQDRVRARAHWRASQGLPPVAIRASSDPRYTPYHLTPAHERAGNMKMKRPIEEQERGKSHIYQVFCKLKLRKDADRELLKTDIRAIKGVTVVTTVPESEKTTESFSYQVIKIKFQPYGTPPAQFVSALAESFRKLTRRGLSSFHFNPESLKKIGV